MDAPFDRAAHDRQAYEAQVAAALESARALVASLTRADLTPDMALASSAATSRAVALLHDYASRVVNP